VSIRSFEGTEPELHPDASVDETAVVVGRRVLVRTGAIVLDDSVGGERGMVGANSLVTEGTVIPPKTLASGTPAEVLREVEDSPWGADG
jgi:carbonic anhydrase/acetyltransferase-like protein (isoleucine patch superfamily)